MSAYRHCITEESADRQRQFEQALLELLQHKAFSQIAVKEVCDRVGLSRKSFYRYFSGLESCMTALVDHTILDFTDMYDQDGKMKQLLEQFFAYWLNHRQLLEVICRNQLANLLYDRAMLWAAQEYGLREAVIQDSSNYEQTVFFISGLFGVLLNWYACGCEKTPAQMAASLGNILPDHPQGMF